MCNKKQTSETAITAARTITIHKFYTHFIACPDKENANESFVTIF